MMPDKALSCCFTGHRPEHLPWGGDDQSPLYNDFYMRMTKAVEAMLHAGHRLFCCGMARGVDMIAAQVVLGLREAQFINGIRLTAACPYPGQADKWPKEDRKLHQMILNMADEVVYVSDSYTPFCFHERNRYMVDRSSAIIAGYDGQRKGGTSYTLNYAKKQGLHVVIVPPVAAPTLFDWRESMPE